MRRAHPILAFCAAMVGSSALAQFERPGIKPLRFEEDWRALCQAQHRTEPLDRLKCLPLAGNTTLTLGGEFRERYETVRNPLFGLIDRGSDEAVLQRVLIHADVRVADTARVFLQLGDHRATSRDFRRLPTDENRVDLQQGFVELSAQLDAGSATVRVGRQELQYGSARLVSVREGPNVRRSFDGGRIIGTVGAARIDGFYVCPVSPRAGSFDDTRDRAQSFWGVYGSALPTGLPNSKLDLYYLNLHRERGIFAVGTAREQRQSVGGRFFGRTGAFDYDVEGVYQFGSFGERRIRAWTVASDSGVTLASLPLAPRFGLKADVASGDGDLTDGTLGTFNALYPILPYFTEAAIVEPSNLMDLQPSLTLHPAGGVAVTLGWNILWRHRRADAYYAPPLTAVPRMVGTSRFLGHQASVRATWQLTSHFSVVGEAVHFEPGDGLRTLGGQDGDFLVLSGSVKF